jgi:hypothetical protein
LQVLHLLFNSEKRGAGLAATDMASSAALGIFEFENGLKIDSFTFNCHPAFTPHLR